MAFDNEPSAKTLLHWLGIKIKVICDKLLITTN